MPAGKQTRVTTTVRNLGSDELTWFHDGCAILVHVWGEMAEAPWRLGASHDGISGTFKERALKMYFGRPIRDPIIEFVPERRLSMGSVGCTDTGIPEVIEPGMALRRELVWDGHAWLHWGPPPSGLVTLTGTFGSYWRGTVEPDVSDYGELAVSLDARIADGVGATWLSPPEVIDAALRDPAFVEYLQPQDLGNGRREILWYRPELGAWEVGLLFWNTEPHPTMHLVLIDPHTGDVLDTVDRLWNKEKDGFP